MRDRQSQHARRFRVSICGTSAAAVLLAAVATGAFASAAGAGIDPRHTVMGARANVTDAGRSVRVTGEVRCTGCARFTLAVTVSQRGGGLAQGGVRCVCHTPTEAWVVHARTRQASKLHAGPARVCTWVLAEGAEGDPIDAHQWCRNVTLRV
jgi:hypothetical protein